MISQDDIIFWQVITHIMTIWCRLLRKYVDFSDIYVNLSDPRVDFSDNEVDFLDNNVEISDLYVSIIYW